MSVTAIAQASQRRLLLRQSTSWVAIAAFAGTVELAMLGAQARAADVDITTSTNSGVNLNTFAGTTARIFPGVTVANTGTLIPGGPGSSFPGVFASTRAWTLTNDGTINAPLANGVTFNTAATAGSTVINSGSINANSQGIRLGAGGTVNNLAGAQINAGTNGISIGGGAGTVTNAGIVTAAGVDAISLTGGGIVTNLAGGFIQAHNQSNAVAVVLGTSRTVINSGTIQSNDTGFATGVSLQNGTLVNNVGGQILGAYNGVWANGANPTSITNAGLIEASKAAASGGTPGSAIEADGGGTIINSGIVRSMSTNGTDVGILFIGAGTITNSGTIASLTGAQAILFQGNGTHTLRLDTGSVLTGSVQGGTGTDNLVLLGTGTETINKFLGFETLSMQGANWTLTGNGVFTTSAQIQSGVLQVDGQLTSPTVAVLSGGTLGGTGTIIGALSAASGGMIAPGNAIGTLNVTGNVSFAAGSIYQVEVNAAGQGDRLVATGTATLNGGTVRALPQPGNYGLATTYTIMTASGGVTGTFANVTSSFAFFDPTLTYDANNVFLTLTRNASFFSDVAQTFNQRAVAGALDASPFGSTLVQAILPLTAPQARYAFDALSGEIYASVRSTLLDDSRHVRDAVLGRLRQVSYGGGMAPLSSGGPTLAYQQPSNTNSKTKLPFPVKAPAEPPAPDRDLVFWAHGLAAWGNLDGDGNAATVDQRIAGFLTGADLRLGSDWRAGVAAGYTQSRMNVNARASSADIDSFHLAGYAGTAVGNLALRAGAAYAWHSIDVGRSIAFPGFADRTSTRLDGGTGHLFGEAGFGMALGSYAVEPFARVAWAHVDTRGFVEAGGAAALAGAGQSQDIGYSSLGVRAAVVYLLQNGMALVPRASIAWQHAFGDVTPGAAPTFESTGAVFGIAGVPIARNSTLVEAGADLQVSPRAALGVVYSGALAGDARSNAVRGRFTWDF